MPTTIGAKTYFSIGESINKPKGLVKEAAEAGITHLGISDNMSVSVLPQITGAAQEVGVEIIAGVTLRVVDDLSFRKEKGSRAKNPFFRPVVYAKNKQGLIDIFHLLSQANDEDHFYFEAQLCWDDVLTALEKGNLVMTTGSVDSLFTHKHSMDMLRSPRTSALLASHPDAIFSEGVVVDTPFYNQVTRRACMAARELGIRMVLSRPILHPSGLETHRNTMNCIAMRQTPVKSRWRNEPAKGLCISSEDEAKLDFNRLVSVLPEFKADLEKAQTETQDFHTIAAYRWEKFDINLPDMSDNPLAELVKLAKEGFKRRLTSPTLAYQPPADQLPVYQARLKYELSVLRDMGFENYFLLVRDLVTWSKDNGIIVGPGRGSVGGSLIAFLLDITDVDPIRFNLIFERFINPERLDLPDIDLDFMSSRRQEILHYLEGKYGKDRVAGIANYVMMGSPSAIRKVGTVHGLGEAQIGASKTIPREGSGAISLEEAVDVSPDIDKFSKEFPLVFSQAKHLQGVMTNYGKHAAGVIVSKDPLVTRSVMECRGGERIVNWDKRYSEDFGLVKLDVLGLQTLDLLDHARRYVKENEGETLDFNAIELGEPIVMKAFGEGRTTAVFQFESKGMRALLKKMAENEPLNFEDITATTALYRPGPLEAGLTDRYVDIKRGNDFEDYPHPSTEAALKPTRSVMIYQEQTMQVTRDLAGFTMAEADKLRKAMGKKDADLMATLRDKFVEGCNKHSAMGRETATALFDQIEKFAGYGFNRSHSVAYTILSYWSMYAKVKHPTAFFAAALTILDEDKRLGIVQDAESQGITILPPDINVSTDRFEISATREGGPALVAPWQFVKGLSEKGTRAILAAREANGGSFASTGEFLAAVEKRACNKTVREKLDKIGVFASIDPGSPDPRDKSRLKDQKQYLPNLISAPVKADRMIKVSKETRIELTKVVEEVKTCEGCSLAGQPHPMPRLGKRPKIMIITESPTAGEVEKGKMGEGFTMESLEISMNNAELTLADVYVTSIIKGQRGKGVAVVNEMVNGCSGYLDREIAALQPPVIITLGKSATRHLLPDEKANWEELVGRDYYLAKLDATVVCGFNIGMIYHDPYKQDLLDKVMIKAAQIISD